MSVPQDDVLVQRVSSVLSTYGPFLDIPSTQKRVAVSENVVVTTDYRSTRGIAEYEALKTDIVRANNNDMYGASYCTTRVASLSPTRCTVNFNASFIPDSISSLAWTAKNIPVFKLILFDLCDRERARSSFSWEKFKQFLARIATKGEFYLPQAVIQGQLELTFDFDVASDTLVLVSQKEKLNLIRSLDTGILKNRALATHLLEYSLARRPSSVDLYEWDGMVTYRLQLYKRVPGMGQFDVDGLEGEKQNELLERGNKFLGYGVGLMFLTSLMFGAVVLDKLSN